MPSKSVADILTDFRLRRQRRQFENERRIKENPTAARMEQQKRAFLADKLALMLEGADTAELDAKIEALEREQRAVIEAEVSLLPVLCPLCGDEGVVDGKYCNCLLDELYRSLYGALPTQSCPSFDSFDETLFDNATPLASNKTQRELMLLIRNICQNYIRDFPNTGKPNLLLSGNAGLGKSWMLGCMARAARERGIDVLYIRAADLFQTFFAHRLGEEIPLSFLMRAGLVLIDDLGTEPMTQNVTVEYLFDLLNHRIEDKKHTVVATNLRRPSDFAQRYDERISSRLRARDQWGLVLFEGKDVRLR